jgi:hypothetical protein
MPLQIHTQPDPNHICDTCGGPSELMSQTITARDGTETMTREVSPWTPRCADPWCHSRRARHRRFATRASLGTEPVGRYRLTGFRSRVGVGYLSIVLSIAARGGPVGAPGAHCRCLRLHRQTTRERPLCRQTHPRWAARSAARCWSSGEQQWHGNCVAWQSN